MVLPFAVKKYRNSSRIKAPRHVNFLDKLDAPTYGMTFCDLRTASLRVTGAHEAAWQGAGMLAV